MHSAEHQALGGLLPALRGTGSAGADTARATPCAQHPRRSRGGEDPGAQAGGSESGIPAYQRYPQTLVPDEGVVEHGACGLEGSGPDRAAPAQAGAQSGQAALLRTEHTEPDVAERHHELPVAGQGGVPDRLHRRLLALHRGTGAVPVTDRRCGAGDLPEGRRRLRVSA